MKSALIYFLSLTYIFIGCSTPSYIAENNKEKSTVSLTNIKANLKFLADDELEGREAATRGERLASLFIVSELEKYGVKPAGDNGTYFQSFNLEVNQYDTSSFIVLNFNNSADTIKYLTDFLRYYSFNDDQKELQFVFAGYGINAPSQGYNDYENIDAKGKAVLILPGNPNPRLAPYSSSKAKLAAAEKAGASAIFFILDKESSSRWQYFSAYLRGSSTGLSNKNQISSYRVNYNSASKFFIGNKLSFRQIDSLYSNNLDIPSFPLTANASANIKIIRSKQEARNVVGIIEGNDQNLKNEYVALGAHYDHVGVINGEIYNGADDNGSGTVALLETARLLSQSSSHKRSFFIAFHSAEEKGLLGAEFLTSNLPFINDIIAHINMDMVGREHEDSIHVIGADRISKELHEIVESVNKETVNLFLNYRFNDPADPNQLYYRSDHFHYANQGIPIVFFYDYMLKDYHKPTDTVDKINFIKIGRVTELIYHLSLRLSNHPQRLEITKTVNK
jgi:hypothetical protein